MWLTPPRVALFVCVVLLLAQPLADILRAPDRLTTLPSLEVDASEYDKIARALANSRRFDAIPPAQPPGFVVLLAAVYTFTGPSWLAARLFLWGAFVLCTALAAWLAWRIDGRPLCEMDVQTGPGTAGVWRDQEMECALERDEIATLAVETTGVADLEFGDVVLTWR